MELIANKLIQLTREDEDGSDVFIVERILFVDESGTDVATIDVDDRKAAPVWRKREELEEALEAKEVIFLEVDHCAPPPFTEAELRSRKYGKIKRQRDKILAVIASLIEGENAVRMLFPHERARLIAEVAEQTGLYRKTIYRYIRRWWQGGQTPNAVLGRYYKSGGPGKSREPGEKKRGRKSRITKHENVITGGNISADWRSIIIKGGDYFYKHRRVKSMTSAYVATLARFCNKGFNPPDVNGIKKPILPDPVEGEIFSFSQFKYHYMQHLNRDLAGALKARLGTRRFNLRHRELRGNSTRQAPGPGALYQIDCTLADVYLVSRRNARHVLGRPVICAIIDVFSRMIVGVAVRFESEGWLVIQLALENATADKVAFCAKYDIEIAKWMWPVAGLCDHITGDRGPMESYNADNLAEGLNINVSNTPPYRADWKGIIEQLFRLMNIRVIHQLPGAVDPDFERGDEDYRLKATMDIYEFTQIIIAAVLYHNTEHRMDWYEMDKDMIADEVAPYPLNLYFWGIENRSGRQRERDPESIRINLLPECDASITATGIRCKKLTFSCELEKSEGWRLRTRNNGWSKIKAAYDPRWTDVIYLRLGDGSPSIPCYLDPESPFVGCDWREVEEYYEQKSLASAHAVPRKLQASSDLQATVHHYVDKSNKKTEKARSEFPQESQRAVVRNMRGRKNEEIMDMRRADAQEWRTKAGINDPSRLLPPTTDAAEEDEKPTPFPRPTNLLDIRMRMMNDEQE
jgi:hypothetical protein